MLWLPSPVAFTILFLAGCSSDEPPPTGAGSIAAAVSVAPETRILTAFGDTVRLVATVLDEEGRSMEDVAVQWTSSDTEVVVVTESGLATAVSEGAAVVEAEVDGVSATADLTVDPWQSIASSSIYTCGTLRSGRLYCWGDLEQVFGENAASSLTPRPVGDVRLSTVVAGFYHACGLDQTGAGFCWGDNTWGQLGDGTYTSRAVPTPVAGDHRFTEIAVMTPVGYGGAHTCGITQNGSAYCWGIGVYGQLGVGEDLSALSPCEWEGEPRETFCATEPTAVLGGLQFLSIGLENQESCGVVASGGSIYCWGLFKGTEPQERFSSRAYTRMTGLIEHSCAIDESQVGLCWGSNVDGKLGGSGGQSPGPISGGHRYAAISAGGGHTCAVTVEGVGLCWGADDGRLGRGSTEMDSSGEPQLVVGGLVFKHISATGQSCGITEDGGAWCWGINNFGQLGDGTDISRGAPVRVVDPGS